MAKCSRTVCDREATSGPHLDGTGRHYCGVCRVEINEANHVELVPRDSSLRSQLTAAFGILVELDDHFAWHEGMLTYARYGGMGRWRPIRITSVNGKDASYRPGWPCGTIESSQGCEDTCGDTVDPPEPELDDFVTHAALVAMLGFDRDVADPALLVDRYRRAASLAISRREGR